MFKLSLSVQRFVIACILLMMIIIGADALLNDFWTWSDRIQDVAFQTRMPSY